MGMKKIQEKKKIQIYKIKQHLHIKSNHKDDKHQVPNSRGQQLKHKISQYKRPYPLKPRQIKPNVKLKQDVNSFWNKKHKISSI
jgi:hypothetical protein